MTPQEFIDALIAEAKETVTPRQREIIKLLQPKPRRRR